MEETSNFFGSWRNLQEIPLSLTLLSPPPPFSEPGQRFICYKDLVRKNFVLYLVAVME